VVPQICLCSPLFFLPGSDFGLDGKRKITYQIEKNNSLVPHCKKDVGNPFVKNRNKYEREKEEIEEQTCSIQGRPRQGWLPGRVDGYQDWSGEEIEASLIVNCRLNLRQVHILLKPNQLLH
jgi:hypothetical protein